MESKTKYPKKPVVFHLWAGIIFLSTIGVLILIGGLNQISRGDYIGGNPGYQGKDTLLFVIGMILICTAFTGGLSWLLIRKHRKKLKIYQTNIDTYYERKILKYAITQSGRVTPVEISLNIENLNITQAKLALDRMVSRGMADMLIAQDGTLVYYIQGITPDKSSTETII